MLYLLFFVEHYIMALSQDYNDKWHFQRSVLEHMKPSEIITDKKQIVSRFDFHPLIDFRKDLA